MIRALLHDPAVLLRRLGEIAQPQTIGSSVPTCHPVGDKYSANRSEDLDSNLIKLKMMSIKKK